MRQFNYDYELFYEFGGSPENEPYIEIDSNTNGKEQCSIYLCADCIDWKDFSRLAVAAKQAHILQRHPMYAGQYIEKDFIPISGKPAYILEDLGDSYAVLVNIQCPNAADFVAVKESARLKIEEIQRAKQVYGSLLWESQVNGTRFKKNKANADTDVDVEYLLGKFGIYAGNRAITKF